MRLHVVTSPRASRTRRAVVLLAFVAVNIVLDRDRPDSLSRPVRAVSLAFVALDIPFHDSAFRITVERTVSKAHEEPILPMPVIAGTSETCSRSLLIGILRRIVECRCK